MNRILKLLGATAMISGSLISTSTNSSVGQENEIPQIKITDRNLSPINMGLDSTVYWIEKMKSGDARRAASIRKDFDKLHLRFQRIPLSDSKQYLYVKQRIQLTAQAIAAKAGETNSNSNSNPNSNSNTEQAQPKPHRNLGPVKNQLVSLERDLNKMDSASLHGLRKLVQKYRDIQKAFSRIPESTHRDYLDTRSRLAILNDKLAQHLPTSDMTFEQASSLLEAMRKKYYRDNELPQARKMFRNGELKASDVAYFLNGVGLFENEAKSDLAMIKAAALVNKSGISMYEYLNEGALEEIEKQKTHLKTIMNSTVELAFKNAKIDCQFGHPEESLHVYERCRSQKCGETPWKIDRDFEQRQNPRRVAWLGS